MKTITSFCFFLILSCCILPYQALTQQRCWARVNPTPQATILSDVFFIDSLRGWTVGQYGKILKTTDGGETWMSKNSNVNNWLESVHFVDSLTGWTVGSLSTILKTTDGGETWNSLPFPFTNKPLSSVYFINHQKGFAVGGGFSIFKTVNGGTTWTEQDLGIIDLKSIFFIDSMTGWILGWDGPDVLLKTTNGGVSWTTVSSGAFGGSAKAFHFTDPQRGWVINSTKIYHTSDGGYSWVTQHSEPFGIDPFEAIYFPDSLHGWVFGWNGYIRKTDNGGQTWVQENNDCNDDIFYGAHFENELTGWAVGTLGKIIKYKPLPAASISASENTICSGDSLTLTANTNINSASYQWFLDDGNNSIGSGQTLAVPVNLQPGNHQFRVRIYQNLSPCCDSLSLPFFIEVLEAPNVIVSNKNICYGSSATLTTSAMGNYLWNTSETISSITVTPTETTTYSVTVTAINGCTDADDAVVTVNPLPVAEAWPDTMVCAGEDVTISAIGGGTYKWSSGQTSSSITVSPDSSTNYIVTVTNSFNCKDVDTVEVIVLPLPLANAGTDQTVCTGESITLTASGGDSYQWNFGVQQGQSFIQTVPVRTYRVTVTDANDCSAVDMVKVTVVPAPAASISADQSTICYGDSLTLAANTNASAATYEWYLDNESNPVDTGKIIFVPANLSPGQHQFRVRVTMSGSVECDSLSLPFYLQVLPLPTAGFTFNADGPTVAFTNTSDNSNSYIWNFGDGSTSTAEHPQHIYLNNGNYVVTLTAFNDCGSELSTQTVLISTLPVANFTYSATQGCAPFTVQFTDLSSSNTTDWQWSFQGGTPSASTQQNPEITYFIPGNYSVTLTAGNAAGSSTIAQTDIIHIADSPIITATVDNNNITPSATGGTPPYVFSISPGGVFENLPDGTYTITVTDANGCIGTVSVGVVNTVEPKTAWGLAVLPNPGRGLFEIMLENAPANALHFDLFDGSGRLLQSFVLETTTKTLDLTDLPAGLYALRISDGEKSGALRVMIVK